MARTEIRMPKLGESVIEATITRWLKGVGEKVAAEEPIAEVATDKVDTEIVSTSDGVLVSKAVSEGDVVPIGGLIAIVETDGVSEENPPTVQTIPVVEKPAKETQRETSPEKGKSGPTTVSHPGTRFYSPLVKSIAIQENIPLQELEKIPGTGKDDRVTKQDILDYLKNRTRVMKPVEAPANPPVVSVSTGDEIIEMDRIRRLIADHMVRSVQTAPHVTSYAEVDMTRVVNWREKNKESFQKRENQKLTFTPVFIEAIARAVRDYPMVNVSVDGTRIILHRDIHIGMAVALPNSNLIVPVIKNAAGKSLLGLVREVNDLAGRAREGKLQPDDIAGGTISLTNLGSFGTLMGTPIINQPQTAIVAVGSIKKRPVVVENPDGDSIAVRHIMIASVSYDHRVIDGALAGNFLNRLVFHLENFNPVPVL